MGNTWSQKALTNTVDGTSIDPDVVLIPLLNENEPTAANKNQFITVADLVSNVLSQLGVCIVFTATGTATSTVQDNRLIGKVLADVKQLVIGGQELVSQGLLSSLNTVTGTISFSSGIDFGGASTIITLG